jgi:ribosome biogenesis GTPase / thiamine phosphate phosphatase
MGKPKKGPREKDLTSRYMSGDLDEDRVEHDEHLTPRGKRLEHEKILRTSVMRAEEESGADIQTLPIGQVVQIHSIYSDVEHEGKTYLCVVRKTLRRISDTQIVVGDRVRFRPADLSDDQRQKLLGDGQTARGDLHTAVIEQVLPRETILLRSDSFKAIEQHPIVANAQQMLIVASVRLPNIKWGLIDRMLVAAQSGGLRPVICLNKIDLIPEYQRMLQEGQPTGQETLPEDAAVAEAAMGHYQSLGITVLRTSAPAGIGIDALRDLLAGKETVLAGHSGVGKSSLINAVQSDLDLRIGDISRFNDKGRHTTTSARRYPLAVGGAVIDTPGVKLFGLWGVTAENLVEYFPDIAAGTAPQWRAESYQRIARSLQ